MSRIDWSFALGPKPDSLDILLADPKSVNILFEPYPPGETNGSTVLAWLICLSKIETEKLLYLVKRVPSHRFNSDILGYAVQFQRYELATFFFNLGLRHKHQSQFREHLGHTLIKSQQLEMAIHYPIKWSCEYVDVFQTAKSRAYRLYYAKSAAIIILGLKKRGLIWRTNKDILPIIARYIMEPNQSLHVKWGFPALKKSKKEKLVSWKAISIIAFLIILFFLVLIVF